MLPPFRLRILPRTLRFKQPAGTSRGVYHIRRVWYILLTSASPETIRFTGLGECAPLHDLSCDFPHGAPGGKDEEARAAVYEARLREICAETERRQSIDYEKLRAYPSILMGLETAFISAKASLKGDFLQLFDNDFSRRERGIKINGLVWMGNFEEMLQRMEQKLETGFRCIKLKIGAIDFESESALISALRHRFSKDVVEIRVDANGAFSPTEAPARLEALSRFGLHSIEQPIRAGQWREMARLCAETPLPIALDEELIGVNSLPEKRALLSEVRPQYIILKPMLHGGLSGAEEWMREASERRIPFWVTSALESNVGLNAIAQWTASLAERYDSLRSMPQGLGTGQLFERNFDAADLHIEADRLWRGDERQRLFEKELADFRREWADETPVLTVHTSGSTGVPQALVVEKKRMAAGAAATCRALDLHGGDTALLAMPLKFIAGKMMAVRAFTAGLRLVCVAPGLHPFSKLREAPCFAALTPMQVFETLKNPRERRLLRNVKKLIIGGGAVSPELAAQLLRMPGKVWSTYGMTETLSHIALRRLNGPERSDFYTPLPDVRVFLSEEGCICVEAPAVADGTIVTRDLGEINANGDFRIIGRIDNVVCSGGLKFHLEELEEKLHKHMPCAFQLTAVPDARLGEALTLLHCGDFSAEMLEKICREQLERHEVPRKYIKVAQIPLTPTGKPARAEARKLAEAGA